MAKKLANILIASCFLCCSSVFAKPPTFDSVTPFLGNWEFFLKEQSQVAKGYSYKFCIRRGIKYKKYKWHNKPLINFGDNRTEEVSVVAFTETIYNNILYKGIATGVDIFLADTDPQPLGFAVSDIKGNMMLGYNSLVNAKFSLVLDKHRKNKAVLKIKSNGKYIEDVKLLHFNGSITRKPGTENLEPLEFD
jgi:hypothetical protein